MSDDLRPWLEEGAPEGLGELLESAAVDEPTAQQLIALQGHLAPLFWTPPPGGGGGDGGAGAGGGGSAPPAAPGAGAGAGASAAGGAATTAGLAVGTKIALVATMSTLVAGAVTFQAGRAYERKNAPPPVVAPAPARAPVAVAPTPPAPEVVKPPEPDEPPKPVARPAPKPVAPAPEATKAPEPAKADELDALQDAMESVRSGKPADALVKLERHAKEFPDSALAQERDVLIIESLVNLGRTADAHARADAFRKKWPTSTHLVRIETLLHKE